MTVKDLKEQIESLLSEGKISETDEVKLYSKHPWKDYYEWGSASGLSANPGEFGIWPQDNNDEENETILD